MSQYVKTGLAALMLASPRLVAAILTFHGYSPMFLLSRFHVLLHGPLRSGVNK